MGNKEIAAELFARFSRSDIPGVLSLMTDDVVWRIPGKKELSPAAGDYGKERIGRLFNRMLSQLESGLQMTVLGSVGSGAEIVAGGSIHIYGTLRGRAMAGVNGNSAARIYCQKIEAELLAIDGYYQTAEEIDVALRNRPAQAWLEGDVMRIAPLS